MKAPVADRTAVTQLLEAYEACDASSCAYWACPGPETPFTPMATCGNCRAHQLLGRALIRMGINPPLTARKDRPVRERPQLSYSEYAAVRAGTHANPAYHKGE